MKHISDKKKSLLACASILVLASVGYTVPANAQVPDTATSTANPARVGDQIRPGVSVPNLMPRVEVKDIILQEAPAGAENMRFVLKSIQLDGATAYSESEIQSIYNDRLGQEITLAELYGIAREITNKYRNEGYILTQVIVPPQTIDGGDVKLTVVEGFVDKVNVEGAEPETAMSLIRQYAAQLKTGTTLNIRDLERYLLLINDLPGIEARSVIGPSSTTAGAADINIIVERNPYDALVYLDNFGSRYLGPVQMGASGSLNSLLGYNERISGQVVITPDFPLDTSNELAYLSLSYEQPISSHGTKLELSTSITDTEPGYDLEPFQVEGRSFFVSAGVSHPFIRSRTENLYANAVLDYRNVKSKNIVQPNLEDRIRAVRIGADYEFLDTLIGLGINRIGLQVSQGVDILNSSDKGDANLTRGLGDPDFTKANATVQRLQRVTSNVNVLVKGSGQVSSAPLLSSEEFGVGGVSNGRGYSPSEILGDEGIAGSVEVQWNDPVPVTNIEGYQLYSFFDIGRTWNQDATTNSQKVDSVSSAGVGVRADFTPSIEGGLAVAFPLTRDVQTRDDKSPLVYFNLSKKF